MLKYFKWLRLFSSTRISAAVKIFRSKIDLAHFSPLPPTPIFFAEKFFSLTVLPPSCFEDISRSGSSLIGRGDKMSRTKKEVNLVKKEVVNLARKEKNGVNLAKKECQSGKKRMWRGSKTFMFKASTILFLDEEKENNF